MFTQSDAYERFMGRWSRKLAPAFVAFVGEFGDGLVLDVGCGTGALTFALAHAQRDVRVHGIDPSAEFIEHARANLSDDLAVAERVRFEIGDAHRLDFADGAVDGVLSMLVFGFLSDPSRALAEQVRVTRPAGTVAAAVWDYGEGMEMLRAFWEEVSVLDPAAGAKHERNMPLCKRGELGALWREGGLVDVEERPLTIDLSFASFDDYWMPFLGGVGPAGAHVASLDPAKRDALRERLRARLLGASGADRAFTLAARAWAVRGRVAA